jgi:hypothetical protein
MQSKPECSPSNLRFPLLRPADAGRHHSVADVVGHQDSPHRQQLESAQVELAQARHRLDGTRR